MERYTTLFDGIARHTQEGLDFVNRSQEVGLRAAVRERDDLRGLWVWPERRRGAVT